METIKFKNGGDRHVYFENGLAVIRFVTYTGTNY